MQYMDKIGEKIKKLRFERGMTLKDLSDKTGLSVSFLLQIERGSSLIAITSLKIIADSFNVKITVVFEEIENYCYVSKKVAQEPCKIEGSYVNYICLAGKLPERKLEAMKVILKPKQAYVDHFSHPGEEFYYILRGTIVFKVEEE